MVLKVISPVLSIILAVLIFFFFTKPLFAEIEALQAETNEYREAVEKATEFNNFLQSLITTRNSFSANELERLELLVPEDVDEVRALVDIKALAEEHRMLFGNIEVEKSKQTGSRAEAEEDDGDAVTLDDLGKGDVSFGVIGTYEQMRSFLRDLERSLVLMEVVELDFSAATEGELYLFDFTVRLYSYNPSAG